MRVKKRYFGVIILIVIVIAVLFYYKPFAKNEQNQEIKPEWFVDKNGFLSYPLDRGNVTFSRTDYSINDSLLISKIIFQSKKGNVYGLLAMPTSATELLPGIILLPGAGVAKESELELAKKIAELGAVVLVIDQRGVGETDGIFPNLDEDFAAFTAGQEPYQHLLVYDALRAYDLLNNAPFVDSGRIILTGESLGGRIAVIAAAIDRNLKGVLLISTAGLNFKPKGDVQKDIFLQSIDSDHYIDLITPRKIVMIHNVNDKIVPFDSAINSFRKAQEPKQFVLVNDTSCNHGYCDSMYDGLVESLDFLVDIKSRTLVSVPAK